VHLFGCCKSINNCEPLIVQILRVVENRKLLWPQTFSGTYWRFALTRCTPYSQLAADRYAVGKFAAEDSVTKASEAKARLDN